MCYKNYNLHIKYNFKPGAALYTEQEFSEDLHSILLGAPSVDHRKATVVQDLFHYVSEVVRVKMRRRYHFHGVLTGAKTEARLYFFKASMHTSFSLSNWCDNIRTN